ncbi:MAG: tetratricopeptide repeat protein [Thermoanaerobaculia bacterium]|nr:tetratricopeptide repeat protein [Thermoanaerobaculia bacterium]
MAKKSRRKRPSGRPSPAPVERAKATMGALGVGAALLVWLVAFAIRAGVAHDLGKTILYQSPQLDAMEFLDWAGRIATGDLSLPAFPTHGPGYPLFLGTLLSWTDGSLAGVRWLQAALGAGTCVLVALLAGRFWGRLAGLFAGLVMAVHGPLVMAETALWEDGLLLFWLTALLLVFDQGRQRPMGAALVSGLVLGFAVLVRPTPLVLLPGLLLLLTWKHEGVRERLGPVSSWLAAASWPRRAVPALLLALACTAIVAPAVVWVSSSVGEFLFLRGFGAINLYIGNDPAGGGVQNARVGGDWDLLESAPQRQGVHDIGRLESFYTQLTLDRAVRDPMGLLGVLASKAAWLTQAEEPRDNHSYFFFRERSKLLGLLPGYGWLFALAALGATFAFRDDRLPPVLVMYVAVQGAVVIVTLMGMRYRLPLIPGLAPFAGLALAQLVDLARKRHLRRLAVFLVALAVIWGLTHIRRHEPSHVFAEELTFTGSSLVKQGRLDEAEAAFRQATEEDPKSGIAWDGLGRTHLGEKRWKDAEQALRRAVDVDPNLRRGHYHLAVAQKAQGKTEEAIESLRRSVAIGPTYVLALRELGTLLVARGDLDEAAEVLESLLRQTPGDAQILRTLAQLEGARGQAAEGLPYARRAADLAPDAETYMLLGFLAVQADSAADARAAADRLRSLLGETDPRYRVLAGAALFFEGNARGAQRILVPLVSEYPGNAPARQLLMKTADAAGNREEIEAYLRSSG